MPNPTFSQAARPLEIQTPLGDNVLGLRRILVQERLGRPFTIEADLSSDDPDVKFDDIVGHPVVVRLNVSTGEKRFWHGFVARFQLVGKTESYFDYRATIVPWVWLMSRAADFEIFQEKSVPDIIQEVFRNNGGKDFELHLNGTYDPWEYCVQYRETDLNFVSRLMEQEGITYYFKHTDEKAMLVLGDDKSAFQAAEGFAELPFRPTSDSEPQLDAVRSWTIEHEVQPTQYSVSDYNPLDPKTGLERLHKVARDHGAADRQIFDYPGEYETTGQGETLAQIRLEELQAGWKTVRAETNCLGLYAGCLLKVADHPRAAENQEHLITAMQLQFDAGDFDTSDATPRASCSFTAIPSAIPFRPPRLTPKPVVQGPQSAVVVGVSGEEIDTDEHGRVKVKFFWDRYGEANEKASCWVRVATTSAGKGWGAISLPRVGQEVLVEFMEGDPDRPIITGRVYNKENKPPYPLPAKKTVSTFKSNSSKGGEGFNELRFEDEKGKEQIFIHAEKDIDVRVKNDAKEFIGHNTHLIVNNDQVESVGNDRHAKIKRDHVEEIGRDRHRKVKGKEAIEVTGSRSVKVADDVIEEFEKNQSTKVTKNLYIKAENITLEATKNLTIHVGDSFIAIEESGIKIATNGEIAVEAKKNITQKATMNFTLEATQNMEIKGTAGLKAESPAQAEVKSANTTVKGDGMVTIQGGLVKIN